ncbi:MAG: hypothetical protein WCL06_10670 [Bacteroidota bacterium]
MATEIQINSLTVLLADRKAKYSDLIQLALNQNASAVPALAGITYDDTAMHGYGNALQVLVTKYKATPPQATKAEVDLGVNKLVDAYDQNAGEIQAIARSKARAAGDVNAGILIVQNAGYLLKSPKSAVENTFMVQADGPGAVKVKTKSVAKRAVYIREGGKTSGKEVVPLKAELMPWFISTENDIRVENLESGAWYAFREAYIVPVSRKTNSPTPETNVEKKVTPTQVTKAHKRTFQAENDSNYNFGPWNWVVVQ